MKFKPAEPRRVAIVGSRHLTDYARLAAAIRSLHILRPGDVIVSGGANGIDTLVARFARQNGHELIEHQVDQALVAAKLVEGLDRTAAFAFAAHVRNSLIVRDSYSMIAIACDHSKGTYDSIRKMRAKLADDPTPGVTRLFHFIWECGKAW
jgi:hypothetical protein